MPSRIQQRQHGSHDVVEEVLCVNREGQSLCRGLEIREGRVKAHAVCADGIGEAQQIGVHLIER